MKSWRIPRGDARGQVFFVGKFARSFRTIKEAGKRLICIHAYRLVIIDTIETGGHSTALITRQVIYSADVLARLYPPVSMIYREPIYI